MPNRKPLVMKFGGSSLEDAAAFSRVAQIVADHLEFMPVVVVSAIRHMTDTLVAAAALASRGEIERAVDAVDLQFERHDEIALQLLSSTAREDAVQLLRQERELLHTALHRINSQPEDAPRLTDEIVSRGEQISAGLFTLVLRSRELPARYVNACECIITDSEFGNASPLIAETTIAARSALTPVLEAAEIPVLGGFIASNKAGIPTTLGRNGSDFTAALIGEVVDASEIQIWSNVPGVLTADPAIVADPRTVTHLTYREAEELACLGAKVLYPKTILPAARNRIPITILNSHVPAEMGTTVSTEAPLNRSTFGVVTRRLGVMVIKATPTATETTESLKGRIAEFISANSYSSTMVSSNDESLTLAIFDTPAHRSFIESFGGLCDITIALRNALVSVVRFDPDAPTENVVRALNGFTDSEGSPIIFGSTEISLLFVVPESEADRIARLVHDLFQSGVREGNLDRTAIRGTSSMGSEINSLDVSNSQNIETGFESGSAIGV